MRWGRGGAVEGNKTTRQALVVATRADGLHEAAPRRRSNSGRAARGGGKAGYRAPAAAPTQRASVGVTEARRCPRRSGARNAAPPRARLSPRPPWRRSARQARVPCGGGAWAANAEGPDPAPTVRTSPPLRRAAPAVALAVHVEQVAHHVVGRGRERGAKVQKLGGACGRRSEARQRPRACGRAIVSRPTLSHSLAMTKRKRSDAGHCGARLSARGSARRLPPTRTPRRTATLAAFRMGASPVALNRMVTLRRAAGSWGGGAGGGASPIGLAHRRSGWAATRVRPSGEWW